MASGSFASNVLPEIYSGLIPALVLVIIVDGLVIHATGDPNVSRFFTLKTLIANLFMLEGYRGILSQYLQWSPFGSASPLWTLAIEWHIYIFIGALFFMVAKPRSIPILLPLALFFGQTPVHFLFGAFQDDGVGKGLVFPLARRRPGLFHRSAAGAKLAPGSGDRPMWRRGLPAPCTYGRRIRDEQLCFSRACLLWNCCRDTGATSSNLAGCQELDHLPGRLFLLAVPHPPHGHVCIVDDVAGKRHGAVLDRNQRFKLGRDGPGANRRKTSSRSCQGDEGQNICGTEGKRRGKGLIAPPTRDC